MKNDERSEIYSVYYKSMDLNVDSLSFAKRKRSPRRVVYSGSFLCSIRRKFQVRRKYPSHGPKHIYYPFCWYNSFKRRDIFIIGKLFIFYKSPVQKTKELFRKLDIKAHQK